MSDNPQDAPAGIGDAILAAADLLTAQPKISVKARKSKKLIDGTYVELEAWASGPLSPGETWGHTALMRYNELLATMDAIFESEAEIANEQFEAQREAMQAMQAQANERVMAQHAAAVEAAEMDQSLQQAARTLAPAPPAAPMPQNRGGVTSRSDGPFRWGRVPLRWAPPVGECCYSDEFAVIAQSVTLTGNRYEFNNQYARRPVARINEAMRSTIEAIFAAIDVDPPLTGQTAQFAPIVLECRCTDPHQNERVTGTGNPYQNIVSARIALPAEFADPPSPTNAQRFLLNNTLADRYATG